MTGMIAPPPLSPRQRLTFWAHLRKAAFSRHHGEYRALFAPYIPADATVFDVGAHAGQFAKLFAAMAPGGTVHAFEPGRYAAAIMTRALRLNGRRNVVFHHTALGEAEGELVLNTPIKPSGSYGFGLTYAGPITRPEKHFSEAVPVTTMDAFVARAGVGRLDFVKADVEGWEMALVRGATETRRRLRPVFFIELVTAALARAGDDGEAALADFRQAGYRAYTVDLEAGHPAPREAPRAGFRDCDYLLVPEERPGPS